MKRRGGKRALLLLLSRKGREGFLRGGGKAVLY